MKRKALSVLLSVMLVIATICVSNMPSRAVEPDDEMTQDEMWYASENSETTTEELEEGTEATTEVLTEEGTEATTEKLTEETTDDEKVSENIASTETIVDEENSEPQTDAAVNESVDEKIGQENGDGITEADAVDFDANMDTAEGIENSDTSVENDNADKMLPDEGETEETQEEIIEEMLEGAEVEKLENVSMYFDWFSFGKFPSYPYFLKILNENEFDIYLSCLKCYVIDENGNEHDVPVSVNVRNGSDITNDTKGYWGYDNENVLTDESVLIPTKNVKIYDLKITLPEELKAGQSIYMYAEIVKLDDTIGNVVALYSTDHFFYIIEHGNYYTEEDVGGRLENVDIDVYHDGKYLIAGAETNFYVQISNNNDFDIRLTRLKTNLPEHGFWNQDPSPYSLSKDEFLALLRSKGLQIIDPNGNNITNYDDGNQRGFGSSEGILIKAGETVTYRVDCILYLNSDGHFGNGYEDETWFNIWLYSGKDGYSGDSCDYYIEFYNSVDRSPAVSVDKADETVPNMKLDSDAYEALVNSAFTKAEINSGKHLKVDLIIAAVSEANVGQNDLEAIKAVAKKRKIAVILDMNLVRFIDGIISGNVNELDKEIIMTIDVPKEFQAANRKFSIIRLHDGIAEELPDLDDNPNTVTFSTGKFSLYALIYEDVEGISTEPSKSDAPNAITPVKDADKTQQASSPNTGDTAPIAIAFILMFVAVAFAVVCIKRMKKNNM